ncbi:MAG: glycerol-3-phosphate acyltransferase [Pontiellaceae bacterium]|nr:glycerol-3-phosphate acyltransferase [Pontiellaceae bacterium]MBN2785469.1 glycerol-3-phosphate acyltransferase [Pontiellaceae bacterium]
MTGKEIICIVSAYLLGGICSGYYLVRIKCRQDIREQGSGGVGARNVGRILGRSGFIITLLGDSLKGVAAVSLARWFVVSETALALVLFAVIAGHIWPAVLGFRGGRGIATAIGGLLTFDPLLALLLAGLTGVMMIFRRGFILSGLAAFLLLPCAALVLGATVERFVILCASSLIILFAHRERIRCAFASSLPAREA